MKKLNERTISKRENRIPELAEDAVKQARTRTLASGRSVVEAVDGKLIESHPDGTHSVLKTVPAPTQVAVGQKKVRKVK
ncbi:MAG TPA: hypothetical protein DCZ75_08010 [Geobacter sp.]|nr:hypothetical protein [Geobacter sp.]